MKELMKMNYEKSKRIYEALRASTPIKKNMCYNNVFNASSSVNMGILGEQVKVAYCYVEIPCMPLIRHCVMIGESGDIIDVSLVHTHYDKGNCFEHWKFHVFKIMEMEEYWDYIDSHDYRADLPDCEEELKWYKEAKKENPYLQLWEGDFFDYINPLILKETDWYNTEAKDIVKKIQDMFNEA